jgi:hypothetical protein
MQLTDTGNPGERKKLILAGVLGIISLILLWWAFVGFGGSSRPAPPRAAVQPPPIRSPSNTAPSPTNAELQPDVLDQLQPLKIDYSIPAVPEARRNIFVYYERPPAPVVPPPAPSPSPPPPVLIASLSPQTVYARTADFTLEVSGDKITPQIRILVDNTELPTRYNGPQQVTAIVPAALIANPGGRQVTLKSPDGTLYSDSLTLNVSPPPTPNYTYIGIIGTPRYIDTAILQDKGAKDLLNVQRGDLLGGRFRVNSISEKELVLIDTTLKIRHTIPFTAQTERGNPLQRPTPRIESEDDEPQD